MKRLYWRPQRISARVIILLAAVAVAGLFTVETFKVQERRKYYSAKLRAARLAHQAFLAIKDERARRRIPVDATIDPQRSALIGPLISPITTNTGHLPAKRTSLNPNFAAVFVHLLKRAGVEEGDPVAVGTSGSFPALNITMLAAIRTLKARPLIISSVGSSQFGANHPDFTYLDMERALRRRAIFPFRSITASLGGVDDLATGLTDEGRQQLIAAIQRNGLSLLSLADGTENLNRRMALYREHAGEQPIKAYVNVGGGTTSVGTRVGKRMFKPGLNRTIPRGAAVIDSVMTRFARRGVPVIHVTKVDELADRYGLPLHPRTPPRVGEGKIFAREEYSTWLVLGVLAVILALMFGLLRLDLAYRLFQGSNKQDSHGSPEQMV
jgi:poly-gamma-glutamate system protein